MKLSISNTTPEEYLPKLATLINSDSINLYNKNDINWGETTMFDTYCIRILLEELDLAYIDDTVDAILDAMDVEYSAHKNDTFYVNSDLYADSYYIPDDNYGRTNMITDLKDAIKKRKEKAIEYAERQKRINDAKKAGEPESVELDMETIYRESLAAHSEEVNRLLEEYEELEKDEMQLQQKLKMREEEVDRLTKELNARINTPLPEKDTDDGESINIGLTARKCVALCKEFKLNTKINTQDEINALLACLTGKEPSSFHKYWSEDSDLQKKTEAWAKELKGKKLTKKK